MGPYIYGARNGIHIMDLTQTVPMLDDALKVIRDTVAKGGSVLFVGTKRQAAQPIAEAAEKCAQYYMNHRWLGGTLTNWQTVSQSINRLKNIDEQSERGFEGLTKKERLGMERDQYKLEASLGGIREMGGRPDLLFVIDVKKKHWPSPKPTNWASQLLPWLTPTARPTALTISSPATTTRPAPSRFTAIWHRALLSTACPLSWVRQALIWAPWKKPPKKKP